MWKISRFPILCGSRDIEADQLFLGWKSVLAYRDGVLKDLTTNKEIIRGPLSDCSLSRDYCAILNDGHCRVLGLYDNFAIDLPFADVQQVCLLERDRIAVRTRTSVAVYDLASKSTQKSWPIHCTQIAAGFDHIVALSPDNDGGVLCWGDGSRGQQGSGELASSEDLVTVDALEEVSIAKIAAGGWHCSALSRRGLVYQWGWNQHGQLEPNDIANGGRRSVIASPVLQNVGRRRIVAVACGSRHSVALDELGEIRSWGWNDYGQCDLVGRPRKGAVAVDDRTKVTDELRTGEVANSEMDTARVHGEHTVKDDKKNINLLKNSDEVTSVGSVAQSRIRAAFWTTAICYPIEGTVNF